MALNSRIKQHIEHYGLSGKSKYCKPIKYKPNIIDKIETDLEEEFYYCEDEY